MTVSSTSHESMWAERVRSWKSSGETATEFARQGGFTASALRYWATRLGRSPRAAVVPVPAMVRLVSKSMAVTTSPSTDLVVEIGVARIRVTRGFDVEVLAAVARALGGAGA